MANERLNTYEEALIPDESLRGDLVSWAGEKAPLGSFNALSRGRALPRAPTLARLAPGCVD